MNKATAGMYDYDDAGRAFVESTTIDAIETRLKEKGYDLEAMSPAVYDRLFGEELIKLEGEAEDDFGEYLADQADNDFYDRNGYYERW